jgi:hypothetical protein
MASLLIVGAALVFGNTKFGSAFHRRNSQSSNTEKLSMPMSASSSVYDVSDYVDAALEHRQADIGATENYDAETNQPRSESRWKKLIKGHGRHQ